MLDLISHLITTNLILTIINHGDLHPLTLHTFTTDPNLFRCGHSPVMTTAWAFEGGDAVGVVTGDAANMRTFTIFRVGDSVTVEEGKGILPILRSYGVTASVA